MPKRAEVLKELQVRRITVPGQHAVGGCSGLVLQVSATGARSWILRYRSPLTGKRREYGMGPYPEVSLAAARDRGAEMVAAVRAGADPVEERRKERDEQKTRVAQATTLTEAVDLYAKSGKLDSLASDRNRLQWASSIRIHILPKLGTRLVSEITANEVRDALAPLWRSKPETGARVRARLESVFAYAIVSEMRAASNPALWKGLLSELLARPVRDVTNQPALSVADSPRWFAALRKTGGEAARALELVALTAMRSGEVRHLVWDEVDLEEAAIAIPAAKMKMKRDFRVPLTKAAVAVLEGAKARCKERGLPDTGQALVFPSPRAMVMSDMTLSECMRRMNEAKAKEDGTGWLDPESKRAAVPHRLRATFRTWAQDHAEFRREMAEAALAHVVGGTEGAYVRGTMFERRREMMEAWSSWLDGVPAAMGPENH